MADKSDVKNHTISARFPKKLVKKLKDIAKTEKRSMSYILQSIVEKEIAARQA